MNPSPQNFPKLETKRLILCELRPIDIGFPLNLISPLKDIPTSDEGDWDAVHAWADSLAALLPG